MSHTCASFKIQVYSNFQGPFASRFVPPSPSPSSLWFGEGGGEGGGGARGAAAAEANMGVSNNKVTALKSVDVSPSCVGPSLAPSSSSRNILAFQISSIVFNLGFRVLRLVIGSFYRFLGDSLALRFRLGWKAPFLLGRNPVSVSSWLSWF